MNSQIRRMLRAGLCGFCVTAAGLALVTGCLPPLWLLGGFPPPPEGETVIVGGSAERVIFAHTRYPALYEESGAPAARASDDALAEQAYEPPRTRIARVNLRTLECEPLITDLAIDHTRLRSDGKWLTWLDAEGPATIHVIDLDSASERTYSRAPEDEPILELGVICDPYLVVLAGRQSRYPIVINLSTGRQRSIVPASVALDYIGNDQLASISVLGSRMVMRLVELIEVSEGVLRAHNDRIDLVDLATGARSTVVTLAEDFVTQPLHLEADRLFVVSRTSDGVHTLDSYPLDGSQPERLLELESISVAAFNAYGLLVAATGGGTSLPLPISFQRRIEFISMDGRRFGVYEQSFGPVSTFGPVQYGPEETHWLVDEFVVYAAEGERGDFLVVNVTTQVQRQFRPFP